MTERMLDVPATEHPVVSLLMALHRDGSDALVAFVEHTTVPLEMILVDNVSPNGSGA